MVKKIIRQPNLEKATDYALWLNFKHRASDKTFGVVHSIMDDYLVISTKHPSFEVSDFECLPNNYDAMTYNHIKHIGMDENPLEHWDNIKGMFSVMDGEHLRFILACKVPLEKFIRFELAARGHDENYKWIGFERAEEIWLK